MHVFAKIVKCRSVAIVGVVRLLNDKRGARSPSRGRVDEWTNGRGACTRKYTRTHVDTYIYTRHNARYLVYGIRYMVHGTCAHVITSSNQLLRKWLIRKDFLEVSKRYFCRYEPTYLQCSLSGRSYIHIYVCTGVCIQCTLVHVSRTFHLTRMMFPNATESDFFRSRARFVALDKSLEGIIRRIAKSPMRFLESNNRDTSPRYSYIEYWIARACFGE